MGVNSMRWERKRDGPEHKKRTNAEVLRAGRVKVLSWGVVNEYPGFTKISLELKGIPPEEKGKGKGR